ncbi:MAG: DUF262 domain-containing protein [Phycisphaerae bacterium]
MKVKATDYSIRDLLNLRKNNMLAPNPEYQRGPVWKRPQKKRLIDSILRGYPISMIYLHHIARSVSGHRRDDLEIIDGQQRIDALYEFSEGAFKLFDPVRDAREARFPIFIRKMPCPWAGKNFDSLDPDIRDRFLDTKLPVAIIAATDANANEPRDLFIRLQAGMPLNAQEKRDAWPGGFTDFVLKVAGKPEIPRYPGHEFFPELMGARRGTRGKLRQLAAQMMMLFMAHRETGGERLCDINANQIDDFYYEHMEFDATSPEAKRFEQVLAKIRWFLGDRRKNLLAHEAIHLVLLIGTLMDHYTRSWEPGFATAFDRFREHVVQDKATRYDDSPGEFWLKYASLTRVNADRADNIRRRHEFFCQKMLEWLSPQPKDPTRTFGPLEREIVYYRDGRRCHFCGKEVAWKEAEIHHVNPHAEGGPTGLANGVLVHKQCHPRGRGAVRPPD